MSGDFRTTPGLIFFYSFAGEIAVTWRIGGLATWLLAAPIANEWRYLPLARYQRLTRADAKSCGSTPQLTANKKQSRAG